LFYFVIAGLDPAIHRNKGNPYITNGRHSGMVREHQTSDAQLRIGESRDSQMCKSTSEFALPRSPE
jgi:hypothetical protein